MRLIDADKLREQVRSNDCAPNTCMYMSMDEARGKLKMRGWVLEEIKNAPTIEAVPVVRCSDCIYWQPPTYLEQEDGSTVGHCTAALNGQQTDAYWFCADGAR